MANIDPPDSHGPAICLAEMEADLTECQARIESSPLHKITRLIEDNPDRAIEVIRRWLN